jgi:hypothetical protein
MAGGLAVLDLEVGDRGLEMRVPVHEALAAVDQAAFVEVDEDLEDGVVEVGALPRLRVAGGAAHGEGLARPVAGRAQAVELGLDVAAGLDLLLPDEARELVAAQVGAAAVGLGELALDDHLGRDAGVVVPGCQRVSSPFMRCQRVRMSWQRVVEGVAHVQRARHVGRGDHDGEGLAAGLGVRAGPEGARLLQSFEIRASASAAPKFLSIMCLRPDGLGG